jgi:regulator of protease activity HflC (stomatin/prohibitin superfamily)
MAIVILLIVLASLGYWIYRTANRVVISDREGDVVSVRRRGFSPKIIGIILIILVVFFLVTSIRVIPVGHAMVRFNVLSKRLTSLEEGVVFVPHVIFRTHIYDLRRQEYTMSSVKGEGRRRDVDDSLWSPTKEGLQVGIDLTCWYRINPTRASDVHKRIGPDYDEKVVRPAIRSTVRLVISEYPIMDVYSEERKTIQQQILERTITLLEPDGFEIEEIILRDVNFTADFGKAIEDKQIAQQEAERMRYILEREQLEADRKKIEAEGKARAIEIVSAKLKRNPEYINYLYVEKLSDDVQLIISDQGTILNLGEMMKPRSP